MTRLLASVFLILACSTALADGTNPLLDWDRVKSMTEAEYLDAVRTANVNERDEKGRTPLHIAARHGNSEAVTALVNSGANSKAKTKDGKTPFDLAYENPQLKGTDAYWMLNDAQYD